MLAATSLPTSSIQRNPGQPRETFAAAALQELADSIKSVGILSPIVVRPVGTGWQIIAGERRWRAAQMAELTEVPVVIRDDVDDAAAFEMAIIENVIRQDMDPMEEARGYQRLLDSGLSVETMSQRIGKSPSAIRSRLSLLTLHPIAAEMVEKGHLDTWSAAHIAATAMLMSRLVAPVIHPNAYYDRLLRATRADWRRLHDRTVARLQVLRLSLASYDKQDVIAWVQEVVPPGAPVIAYPPFYGTDAAYNDLDKLFQWDAPILPPLDDFRRMTLLQAIADRPNWLFGIPVRLPEWEPHLRGVNQTTNRGVPIYLYGTGPVRVVSPRQILEPLPCAPLGPTQELGERLSIAVLREGQFSTLRSEYMNASIVPGRPQLCVGVLVDGVLIGAYAIMGMSDTSHPGASGMAQPTTYLLSDFPVRPTRYRHLAKLVLYAALSLESQRLIERSLNRRFRSLTTTAFADNPVSMKYRSLFELVKRRDHGTSKPPHRYELQYRAPLGRWTCAEGFETWRQRHAEKVAA